MSLRTLEWPRAAVTVARTYGARGALLRSWFELRRRSGRFRAAPNFRDAPARGALAAFAVGAERLAAATDRETAMQRAERVLAGEYQAFRHEWLPLPRGAGAWLIHPRTAATYDPAQPWWRVRHLDPVRGDIKLLWEPARFAWAYDLVRGFLITGDDRFAAAFHHHLAEFEADCPPFRGPHWSCGQETSIRAAALLYAEANLRVAPSSTPEAMQRLARILAWSGERVADAIGYAISQRNNHGISEAAGLVLLGARFRDALPSAEGWLVRGEAWLERLIGEQFARDGWYIQHSFNYMRVALDQCVLAERALEGLGRKLSQGARDRLGAGAGLLGWVIDADTGLVPNHGANDGAYVHPITTADYRDFRPVLTAVCATFNLPLWAGIDADGEVLAWLGKNAPPSAPALAGVRSGESGWAVARVGCAAVFVRAGKYRSRPGHSDALHVDIRAGAQEVVVDPGTYSYNAPPLDREFASAAVHNGPLLDGRDWAVRGARFLWLRWPEAEIVAAGWDGRMAHVVARVPGRVQRIVRVTDAGVEVEDVQTGGKPAPVVVRWLLHPDADPAAVELHPGAAWLKSDPARAAGWFSPYYCARLAAPCAEVRTSAEDSRIISRFHFR